MDSLTITHLGKKNDNNSPIQLPLPHPVYLLLLHRQPEQLLRETTYLIRAVQYRLTALAAGEFEVEETAGFARFEDAVLLDGVFGEEFGQGNGFEVDAFERRGGGEGRVGGGGEFGGVRHSVFGFGFGVGGGKWRGLFWGWVVGC